MKSAGIFLASLLLTASAAQAQVAVATALAENDVTQRDLAAQVVGAAAGQWQMLQPQLDASAVKSCPPGDTACLQSLARDRGASHVLVVAVVPRGVRDHLVAVQLFAVNSPEPVFEESAKQPGAANSPDEVRNLAARLLLTAGPPGLVVARRIRSGEPVDPAPPPAETPAPLALGAPVLLGGVAVVAVSFAAAFPLAAGQDPSTGYAVSVVGGGLGAVVAFVGAGLLVSEAL